MNKSEVPTEPFPVRELRAGGPRLHRARMIGQRELPYGGRALQRLGQLRDPRLPLATRAAAFVTRRWPALALIAVCAIAGAASWRVRVRRENDPVLRAEQMLVAKAPLAALAELDKLNDSPRARSAQVQVLRGKAEHALGQLGMAFADFAAALDTDAGVSDPEVVRALVVAGTERAQVLLARTAAERRRCGSREATDALRRLERAKAEAGATARAATPNAAAAVSSTPASPSSTSLSVIPAASAAESPKEVHKPAKATVKRRRTASRSPPTAAFPQRNRPPHPPRSRPPRPPARPGRVQCPTRGSAVSARPPGIPLQTRVHWQ